MTVGDLEASSAPLSEDEPARSDEPAPEDTGEPSTEEPEEPGEPLADALAGLRERLDALVADGRSATARAEARERVIAHQRDEIDALRAERRGGTLRPLVVGLQKLRAELLAEAGSAPGGGALFAYYADSVLAVLEGCGVERLPAEPGDPFDPAAHTVARTVDGGPEEHRRLVEVLAEGWAEHDSGRVLAPAKVVVGRHRPTDTQREEPTDD